MKIFVYIIPTVLLLFFSLYFLTTTNVQVTTSKSKNFGSLEKVELLKEITELPPELKKLQSGLTDMVVEVEEILAESESYPPLIEEDPEVKENLNQTIEAMYKQAGLNYAAEESRINDAFNSASSDPKTLFSK